MLTSSLVSKVACSHHHHSALLVDAIVSPQSFADQQDMQLCALDNWFAEVLERHRGAPLPLPLCNYNIHKRSDQTLNVHIHFDHSTKLSIQSKWGLQARQYLGR
jgi:hypothetical protein